MLNFTLSISRDCIRQKLSSTSELGLTNFSFAARILPFLLEITQKCSAEHPKQVELCSVYTVKLKRGSKLKIADKSA